MDSHIPSLADVMIAFYSTSLRNFSNCSFYVIRLEELSVQMANVGALVTEQELVIRLFSGLSGTCYQTFAIKNMIPLPSFAEAKSLLLLEEARTTNYGGSYFPSPLGGSQNFNEATYPSYSGSSFLGPRPAAHSYMANASPADLDQAMHTLTLHPPNHTSYMDTGATSHMTYDRERKIELEYGEFLPTVVYHGSHQHLLFLDYGGATRCAVCLNTIEGASGRYNCRENCSISLHKACALPVKMDPLLENYISCINSMKESTELLEKSTEFLLESNRMFRNSFQESATIPSQTLRDKKYRNLIQTTNLQASNSKSKDVDYLKDMALLSKEGFKRGLKKGIKEGFKEDIKQRFEDEGPMEILSDAWDLIQGIFT